jgi:hypothetical protein
MKPWVQSPALNKGRREKKKRKRQGQKEKTFRTSENIL